MKKIKLVVLSIAVSCAFLSASASAIPGVKFPPASQQTVTAD
jgi:hypothetical protein